MPSLATLVYGHARTGLHRSNGIAAPVDRSQSRARGEEIRHVNAHGSIGPNPASGTGRHSQVTSASATAKRAEGGRILDGA